MIIGKGDNVHNNFAGSTTVCSLRSCCFKPNLMTVKSGINLILIETVDAHFTPFEVHISYIVFYETADYAHLLISENAT